MATLVQTGFDLNSEELVLSENKMTDGLSGI
jgi:hypothetical protein